MTGEDTVIFVVFLLPLVITKENGTFVFKHSRVKSTMIKQLIENSISITISFVREKEGKAKMGWTNCSKYLHSTRAGANQKRLGKL